MKKQGVEFKRSGDAKQEDADKEDSDESGQSSNESDDELKTEKPLGPNPLNFDSSDEDASDSGEPLLKISKRDVLKDLPAAKVDLFNVSLCLFCQFLDRRIGQSKGRYDQESVDKETTQAKECHLEQKENI